MKRVRNVIYAFALIAEKDDMTRAGIAAQRPDIQSARMSAKERARFAKDHAPMPGSG